MHRSLSGRIKTIKYDAGERYSMLVCEILEEQKKPVDGIPSGRIKGGDLGIMGFLTLSKGSKDLPDCLRFLRRSEGRIKSLQKILSSPQGIKQLSFSKVRLHSA